MEWLRRAAHSLRGLNQGRKIRSVSSFQRSLIYMRTSVSQVRARLKM